MNPDELKIMLLDNGKFHKGKNLVIPKNIIFLFIPPYSPELNPSEKIWWKFKRQFSGKLHKTLDNVSEFISTQVNSLTQKEVKSICGFEYILNSLFWTKTN
jgi:transposase